MKKYVKPMLIYEKYELSKHIAACAWDLVSQDSTGCHAVADPSFIPGYDGMYLFTQTTTCNLVEGIYEDYCYHDGAQGVNVFQS